MAKFITENYLLSRVSYYKEKDRHGKVFIPNDIFEMLSSDKELRSKQSPDVAVAYSYLWLITWLWRNAKYGDMEDNCTSIGSLKEMIGITSTNKTINYIIKDGGVLDKLGLTKTLNYKEAPVTYTIEENMPVFYTQDELDNMRDERDIEESKAWRGNNRKKTVKQPVFALKNAEGETGGTFYGDIENTHQVEFDIFVKCMTNPKLGCTAFYLYAFLKSKSDVNDGMIEIGGDTISTKTGVRHTSREKALDGLKKHNLVNCIPAPFIVGAGKGDGANVYTPRQVGAYMESGVSYEKRQLISKERKEQKDELLKQIGEDIFNI